MPIIFNVKPNVDSKIKQLGFDAEHDYAISIMPSDGELENLYGALYGFEGSLRMSDLQPEFKIEKPSSGKVKITGNIFEALNYLKEKEGSLGFFTPQLFLELEKEEEINKIILECKTSFEEEISTDKNLEVVSLKKDESRNKLFDESKNKYKVEEFKENDNLARQNKLNIIQTNNK